MSAAAMHRGPSEELQSIAMATALPEGTLGHGGLPEGSQGSESTLHVQASARREEERGEERRREEERGGEARREEERGGERRREEERGGEARRGENKRGIGRETNPAGTLL